MTERTYTQRELDDALRAHGKRVLTEAREALIADGHKPYGVYDECECDEATANEEGHGIELEFYMGCAESLRYMACGECCADGGYHAERCADGHDWHRGPEGVYCRAVAAIDRVLDGAA